MNEMGNFFHMLKNPDMLHVMYDSFHLFMATAWPQSFMGKGRFQFRDTVCATGDVCCWCEPKIPG